MAKVKQQVKYNPKWSEVKRVDAARVAIVGNANIVLSIIFTAFALLMIGVMIISVILNPKAFFEDDFQSIASVAFSGTFMTFAVFALNTTLPFFRISKGLDAKQEAMLGGCVNISKTFAHMPIKKISLFKQSFRYYSLMLFITTLPCILLNIIIMSDPELHFAGGMVTVATIAIFTFEFIMYFANFGILGKNENLLKLLVKCSFVVYYVFWIAAMWGFCDSFVMAEPLCVLAGIPCICFVVIGLAAIIIIEKLYVEKHAGVTSWRFKEA